MTGTHAKQPSLNGSTRLDAALYYAAQGWLVLPLHNPKDGQCSCGNPECGKNAAKHPRTAHGLKDASRDPEQVRRWWRQWPDANIGILTGPESGIAVLDVDGQAGEESLTALIKQHGRPAETAKSATGGGGRHIIFKYPADGRLKNSTSKLGPKLDTRGDGGYIVAPPSVHISGRRYEWINDPISTPLTEPPGWLIDILGRETAKAPTQDEAATADAVIEGGRNAHLTSLAGSMRKRGMSADAILAALKTENEKRCRPPLDESEVAKIASSVARYQPDPEEAPVEQQMQALPEHIDFGVHMEAWRRLINTVARKSPVQQEQYIKAMAARFKLTIPSIRKEVKAAEAAQKLEPSVPAPLAEPEELDWCIAQDYRGELMHYGIWLPTGKDGKEGRMLYLVKSDRSIEDMSDYPAERKPKDTKRWSVDMPTPYNVFAFIHGQVKDDPRILFQDIRQFIKRFMWYPDERTYGLLALWIMESYVFMAFDQVAYLAMIGTKRAGKTRLLEILEMLCFNAALLTSVTDSYVFRSVEVDRTTFLIDEADQLKQQSKEGINERLEILRSGYRRSGSVGRIEGEERQRVDFSTYSMKAIANVSGLEDALEDRTIAVAVERKPDHVKVEKLVRRRIQSEIQVLRNRLYCFGLTHGPQIAGAYDEIAVEGVDDREAEIWAGVIAVAHVAAAERIPELLALAHENSARKELHEGSESPEAQEIMAVWQLCDEAPDTAIGRYYKASRIQEAIKNQLGWEHFSYNKLAADMAKLRIVDDTAEYKQRFRLRDDAGKTSCAMCYKLDRDRVEAAAKRFGVELHIGDIKDANLPQNGESSEEDDSPY